MYLEGGKALGTSGGSSLFLGGIGRSGMSSVSGIGGMSDLFLGGSTFLGAALRFLSVLVGDCAAVQLLDMSVVTLTPSELGVPLEDAVEFLHDGSADGQGLSKDGPLNSLGARYRGERSVVAPEFGEVEILDKISKMHLSFYS